ncbi:uncharacterized protein C20orf204 homolog [Trachemys scripta elegans]|uniref:uncharacterized protein C20orf204 homolog n=1 Tax=Trachemys scripta elegans TaxID=31138 RepID=UPI001553DBC5|nr:uncharacterized protein C20orf204 homolog [Trachemys scripta elegans]
MILPRTLLCAVLLLLLVSVLSKGKAKCSIVEILRQYQAVIFDELQNLKNLTRSAETPRRGRAGLACLSNKEQKILLSISTMSMSLRNMVRGHWRNPEVVAVMQVVSNTESVTKQNCKKIHKKSLSTATEKPRHRGQGNRRKQLKVIARTVENLVTCWEKLFSLHSKDWDT